MKKLVLVSLKTFAFFVGWAICASILPIPDTKSAAVWRFWAELIPLLSVIGFTIIFSFYQYRYAGSVSSWLLVSDDKK